MRSASRASSTGSKYRHGELGVIDDLRTTTIYSSLSTLLFSDKFSDMTIRCGGREFKAHQAIVCTQSSFFDKALTGSFQEGASRIVELEEEDPDIVDCFLQFLYTGNYEDKAHYTMGRPSAIAMATSEEISDEFAELPGTLDPPSINTNSTADAQSPTEHVKDENVQQNQGDAVIQEETRIDEESNDPNYEPPRPEDLETEPPEEYNEYYGESDTDESTVTKEMTNERLADYENMQSRTMFMSLRLYIMADKYDVPTLKLLARDRFYRTAELCWKKSDAFVDIVDELYSCTLDTDLAMREIVCRLVGTQVLVERNQLRRLDAVMRKHGDFAVGVMAYLIHDVDETFRR